MQPVPRLSHTAFRRPLKTSSCSPVPNRIACRTSSERLFHGFARENPIAVASAWSCRQRNEVLPSWMIAMARCASVRSGSMMSFSASTSWTTPRPVHEGQAPYGELNENSRGDSSVSAKPQRGQEWRDESLNDGGGPEM